MTTNDESQSEPTKASNTREARLAKIKEMARLQRRAAYLRAKEAFKAKTKAKKEQQKALLRESRRQRDQELLRSLTPASETPEDRQPAKTTETREMGEMGDLPDSDLTVARPRLRLVRND